MPPRGCTFVFGAWRTNLAEPFDRRTKRTIAALLLAALASTLGLFAANRPPQDPAPDAAICPVVYRLDESPSPRGYRYAFFGNAFFINEQSYLAPN